MLDFAKTAYSILAAALLAMPWSASADLVIPGADGSDGAFAPTESVEIDLSLAPTASWDTPGGGHGVYDPDQWAVVFKYSSVDIPAGVTVTFRNHDSRAAVVWLVSGDANIAGDVILDGQDYQAAPARAEPGPGGYRGGVGYLSVSAPRGGGLGIGGGPDYLSGGNHATKGAYNNGYPTYGNLRVLPLVGGSGGGSSPVVGFGGAAGGGALLLAVEETLTIDGTISAEGGNGFDYYLGDRQSGSGAGGAIHLIAESVGGSGNVLAKGGTENGGGGDGRIRIEAWDSDAAWTVSPAARVMPPDEPVLLWLPDGAPTVEIISIASAPVPADPRAHLEIGEEDVTLDLLGGAADIVLQTHNVDTVDGVVEVRITPEHGEAYPMIGAVFESGTYETATWVATSELPIGYFTVQAHAVNPSP